MPSFVYLSSSTLSPEPCRYFVHLMFFFHTRPPVFDALPSRPALPFSACEASPHRLADKTFEICFEVCHELSNSSCSPLPALCSAGDVEIFMPTGRERGSACIHFLIWPVLSGPFWPGV